MNNFIPRCTLSYAWYCVAWIGLNIQPKKN